MNFLCGLLMVLFTVLELAAGAKLLPAADQATSTFPVINELEQRALLTHMIQHNMLDEGDDDDEDGLPDRIINGEDADTTDAPFQIALHQKFLGFFKYFLCGGSLISARTVLSAGHCASK